MPELDPVSFTCPAKPFPADFTGSLSLGVVGEPESGAPRWLLFEVDKGAVQKVRVCRGSGSSPPESVAGASPIFEAMAQRKVWGLLPGSGEQFFDMASGGKLTIQGSFTEFARLTPSLVRLAGPPEVWSQVERIASSSLPR